MPAPVHPGQLLPKPLISRAEKCFILNILSGKKCVYMTRQAELLVIGKYGDGLSIDDVYT